MANTQESMQRSGAAYSNGFIGIGGAHSSNNKIDNGMSASDWSKISSIVGHSVKNASVSSNCLVKKWLNWPRKNHFILKDKRTC